MDNLVEGLAQALADKATATLNENQGCYVAKWILENPTLRVSDYVLQYQPSMKDDLITFKLVRNK